MISSINRAILEKVKERHDSISLQRLLGSKKEISNRTCIFISHKKEDRIQAKRIADYILSKDIDVYFDEYDPKLTPTVRKESEKLVGVINKGLKESSHMICIISSKTIGSWWVPFEIGHVWGKGMQRENMRANILKGIDPLKIPSYVDIIERLNTYKELDKFLSTINPKSKELLADSYKIASKHPLSDIMN